MNRNGDLRRSLLEVDDSVLIIIDIQDSFLNKYDEKKTQSLVSKVVWLIHAARRQDVPIVAMAEDIENAGSLNQEILAALPDDTNVHSKDFFDLTGNPDILVDINGTGRRTAVCVGMETDVCVAQTAIGLLGEGYRVVALKDAVATTEWDEEIGLSRMREAGVLISSVKAVYYEWVRSVSGCRQMDISAPELSVKRPPQLVL